MIDNPLKMFCVVNAEAVKLTGGNRGKMLAQAGHAYLHAWWDAEERMDTRGASSDYRYSQLAFKIALRGENEAHLRELLEAYRAKCGVALVTDAARTVFNEPTVTCLGIGPIRADQVGEDLKSLKVFL